MARVAAAASKLLSEKSSFWGSTTKGEVGRRFPPANATSITYHHDKRDCHDRKRPWSLPPMDTRRPFNRAAALNRKSKYCLINANILRLIFSCEGTRARAPACLLRSIRHVLSFARNKECSDRYGQENEQHDRLFAEKMILAEAIENKGEPRAQKRPQNPRPCKYRLCSRGARHKPFHAASSPVDARSRPAIFMI